ncbi:MAG: hypothetical protein Q7V88_08960 [Actinomycetota bacterium]|nr:hypothetical protein [Actinomycetota bacterium]
MSHRERVVLPRRALLGGAAVAAGSMLAPRAAQASGARAWRSAAAAGPVRPMGTGPGSYGPLQLYLLADPVRVYDSRAGQVPDGIDPDTGAGDTPLVRNASRGIDVSYVLGVTPTGVDTTSEGVLINLTAVNTVGAAGNLKVWASTGTEPAISVLNWDHASSAIANSVTTRHVDGYILVKCGGVVGCSTNLIVDVLGYYDLAPVGPL